MTFSPAQSPIHNHYTITFLFPPHPALYNTSLRVWPTIITINSHSTTFIIVLSLLLPQFYLYKKIYGQTCVMSYSTPVHRWWAHTCLVYGQSSGAIWWLSSLLTSPQYHPDTWWFYFALHIPRSLHILSSGVLPPSLHMLSQELPASCCISSHSQLNVHSVS